jgi:hypothetical protein
MSKIANAKKSWYKAQVVPEFNTRIAKKDRFLNVLITEI